MQFRAAPHGVSNTSAGLRVPEHASLEPRFKPINFKYINDLKEEVPADEVKFAKEKNSN